jgi:hypothetical protein
MGGMTDTGPNDRIVLSDEEKRRRRARSLLIGWGLAALALIFFLVTLVRLGADVGSRPL